MGQTENRQLTSFLSLGSNLGRRKKNLDDAISQLKFEAGNIINISRVYESEPWGLKNQNFFLNQVIELKTSMSPQNLLICCKNIENKMGRTKSIKWGKRKIDIDILYFSEIIVQEKDLTIPHPLIQDRNFVLIPLNELSKNFIHPIIKKTNHEILKNSKDTSKIYLYGNK